MKADGVGVGIESDGSGLVKVPVEYLKKLGANAAYTLKVLAYRQRGAKRTSKGKLWSFFPLGRRTEGPKSKKLSRGGSPVYRPLSDEIPWIVHQSLGKIVRKLEALKLVEVKRRVKGSPNNGRGYDNTLNYHVGKKVVTGCCEAKAGDYRWFDPVEAEKLGVNAALVLNVIYRDFKRNEGEERIELSRRAISKEVGLPLSTVNHVFVRLIDDQYLSTHDGRLFKLLVPNPCKLKGNGAGRKSVSKREGQYRSNGDMVTGAVDVAHVSNPIGLCMFLSNLQMLVSVYIVVLYFMVIAEESARPVQKRRRGSKPVEVEERVAWGRGYYGWKREENAKERSEDIVVRRQLNKSRRARGERKTIANPTLCMRDGRISRAVNPLALSV